MKDAVVPVRIGRSFDQPMLAVAPASNAFVSRHHVEIQARDGELWCIDLGSANGTWIRRGNESIPTSAHQQVRLEAGDVLMTIDETVLCTIHPASDAAQDSTETSDTQDHV